MGRSRRRVALGFLLPWVACAGRVPDHAITHSQLELIGEPTLPRITALAPGQAAWVEDGVGGYQIVLASGRNQHRVDFFFPFSLFGGHGIGWVGHAKPGVDSQQMCVAAPDIQCAEAPQTRHSRELQVGQVDGEPAVWSLREGKLYRLEDNAWHELPLPADVHSSVVTLLPSGDGYLLIRGGVARTVTRADGQWHSTPIEQTVRGMATLSDSHLIWLERVRPTRPKPPSGAPPALGRLHRIPRDGSLPTDSPSRIGRVARILPHGRDGTLVMGYEQTEYWREDQLLWRLPSRALSSAIWEDGAWLTLGPTRLRIDRPDAIEVTDPTPGRFAWGESIQAEIVDCGSGLGLAWSDREQSWRAWVVNGQVQLGHTCPARVQPWPRGDLGDCTKNALQTDVIRLERGDHTACIATLYHHKVSDHTVVQLGRM